MPLPLRVAVLLCALTVPLAALAAPGVAGATAVTTSPGKMCAVSSAKWHCSGETVGAVSAARATAPGAGYWDAAELEQQYGVTDTSAPRPGNPTVAVVEAYGYPSLNSDLAAYRSDMGLPACTEATGCLTVVNQEGESSPLPSLAPAADDWTVETAVDVDMVSAACPSCNILVVEADDDDPTNSPTDDPNGLLEADKVAAERTHWVSDSWYSPGDAVGDSEADAAYLSTPGTILTAATGDSGHEGTADYPSTSPYAVAVGGVYGNHGGTFRAWSKAGSSCAPFVQRPTAQEGVTRGCAGRAAADVSAVADGTNGIAIYDSTYPLRTQNGTTNWALVSGTSASAPLVAAMYAASRNHTNRWRPYSSVRQTPRLWDDITTGHNGSCKTAMCQAGTGWDGPTGVGMPVSPEAFALPLEPLKVAGPAVTALVSSPLSDTVVVRRQAEDTAGNTQRLARVKPGPARATDLPSGTTAVVKGNRVILSGKPTARGSGTAHVSITGVTPAGRTTTGRVSIPWTVHGQVMATSGTPRLTGRGVHGRTLRVVLPTMHAGTVAGSVVHPRWSVSWLLNGKTVGHGRSYRLPRTAAGERVRVSATANLRGFVARTMRSAVEQVR